MNGWKIVHISDFCTTGTGGTPSRSNMERYYEGGKIPWVKSGELRETIINDTEEHVTEEALQETHLKLIPSGALLLAMYGATVGRLGILGTPATTNQAICHIIPDPRIADVRYLFHLLRSQVPNIVSRGVGGAQPNISQGIVKDLKIPIPPMEEQKTIADILDRAEALRAKRRAAIAQLDELVQSIFIEMFGDPVVNSKKWDLKTIEEIAKKEKNSIVDGPFGASLKTHEYVEQGIPVIRINNIRPGHYYNSDFKYITEEKYNQLIRSKVVKNDILMARVGNTVGKCCLFDQDYKALLSTTGVCKITCDQELINYKFLVSLLNISQYQKYILSKVNGAGQPYLNLTMIKSFEVILPPLELQNKFAEIVNQVEKVKKYQQQSCLGIDSLFDSLVQKAFRGKL